jgi:hypothetical protein
VRLSSASRDGRISDGVVIDVAAAVGSGVAGAAVRSSRRRGGWRLELRSGRRYVHEWHAQRVAAGFWYPRVWLGEPARRVATSRFAPLARSM